jgi:DNA adenine methylase
MPNTDRPALSPLLKWTGGKRSEIQFIKSSYPADIKRVIEPFSGGAAVAFDLNPDRIVLNDLNPGLLDFYRTIQDPQKRQQMLAAIGVVDAVRKRIKTEMMALNAKAVADFFVDPQPLIATRAKHWLLDASIPSAVSTSFLADMAAQAKSKAGARIPALEAKRGEIFGTDLRREHAQTSLQAGIYTTLRRIYNGKIKVDAAWQSGAWWLVRSLCYSGMFRYGRNGDFNVPYGGIAYNSRDFSGSMAQLGAAEVSDFFSRTQINELDFEKLFAKYHGFSPGDFVFVDPPYDSAFSKYNVVGDFGEDDQKRLAAALKKLSVPWMLVIKNTPMILALYQEDGLSRGVFSKTYGANFRNRHARGVEHLVVTNYPLTYALEGKIGIRALEAESAA